MKVILHLDLDSYFASAAVTVQPELKGKPIAITTGERRSIVAAASYEAKNKGVYVPMPFFKAQELVPDLISVLPDYALYTLLSTKVFEYLSTYTKNIEVASIDEAYMDATDIWEKYGSPAALARKIQSDVKRDLKLPISIGISDTKFGAKMSTDINKPFGITVTPPGKLLEVIGDWDLIKFNGIGNPTKILLNEIGIYTIKDLANSEPEVIKDILGSRGPELIAKANGFGTDELEIEHNELKGIGNSQTFMTRDLSQRKSILEAMKQMVYKVSYRAIARNMAAKVVSVSIKSAGGREVKIKRKQTTLHRPVSSVEEIMIVAIKLFDEIWDENPVKFIGVHLGKLEDIFETTYQMSLFDKEVKQSKIEKIINDVNRTLKTKVLMTGKEAELNKKRDQNQSRYIESDRIIKHFDEGMKKKK